MGDGSLAGQRVAVIGGTSGMGRATAVRLAGLGADVFAAARGEAARQALEAEKHPRLTLDAVDFTDEASLARFFERRAPLDHVVVTAASAAMGRLVDLSTEAARAFLEGKLWGQYLTARHAVPALRKGGSLVLFSGAAGRRVQAGFALGSAINAAVETLAAALALELAPIRVNCVAPGVVDTPVWCRLFPDRAEREAALAATRRLPAGRVGRPEEIAQAVTFLLTNDYVTGHTLVVDGGFVLA